MLRAIIVIVGLLCLAFGLFVVWVAHWAWFPALTPIGLGVILLLGTLFEGKYRPKRSAPLDSLQETGEKFVDPATGKLTEVFYDPKTGERVYRPVG